MDAPAKPSADGFIRQGITAFRAGDKETAAYLFSQAINRDPESQLAWVWLFGCVTVEEERRHCLERAIAIDPTTKAGIRAQELLDKLPAPPAKQIVEQAAPQQDDPPPPPPPRKPKPKHKPKPKPVIVETVYEEDEEDDEDEDDGDYVVEYRRYVKKNRSAKNKKNRKKGLVSFWSLVGLVVSCMLCCSIPFAMEEQEQSQDKKAVFGTVDGNTEPTSIPNSPSQPTSPPQPTQAPAPDPTVTLREQRRQEIVQYLSEIQPSVNMIVAVSDDIEEFEDLARTISISKQIHNDLLEITPPPIADDFHQDLLAFSQCRIDGLQNGEEAIRQDDIEKIGEALELLFFCNTLAPDVEELIEEAGLSDYILD